MNSLVFGPPGLPAIFVFFAFLAGVQRNGAYAARIVLTDVGNSIQSEEAKGAEEEAFAGTPDVLVTAHSSYNIGTKLGAGSMGSVFKATDQKSGAPVAIKLAQPGEESRLQYEMKTMGLLIKNPYCVQMLDSVDKGQGVQPAIVMEYVPLGILTSAIPKLFQSAHCLECGMRYVKNTAAAFGTTDHPSHGRQSWASLIHGDIKDENTFLYEEGSQVVFKLGDFGFSTLTAVPVGGMRGTPAYLAPETWHGPPTRASDVWSTGVTLVAMLTGEDPSLLPCTSYLKRPCGQHKEFQDLMPRLREFIPQIMRRFAMNPAAHSADFLKNMLEPNPQKRIRWEQLSEMLEPAQTPCPTSLVK